MSDENIYLQENQECNENYSNNISSAENKSISNTSSRSDLRDEINFHRLQIKNNSDEKLDDFKIVKDCQSGESNEVERRNLKNKEVFSSDDLELYKEYVQWDFINNKLYMKVESLLNIVSKEENSQRGKQNVRGGKQNARGGKQNARGGQQNARGGQQNARGGKQNARSDKQKYELTNTLQMWLLFINEDFNDVPKYEYFTILPDIQLEHPAAQFLRTAIIKKEFATEQDADLKVNEILSFISANHSQVVRHDLADPLHVEHNKARNIVVVNKFQSKEWPRVNLLVTKGGVIATARVLLRYESLGNGSYQWGDPEEVHKVLHDKFDVRYEGFASPVNSMFIEYDKTHFCSLFPETDAAFGSIGNFFHVDMEKHSGGWCVHPPFLNDLMKNIAIRVNEILDAGHKCYFFCTFPWWEDDEGWNILNISRHKLKRFDLRRRHFIIQNAYGRKLKPYMKMNVFVMGELPPWVASLDELANILFHDPMEDLPDQCPW